MGEEKEKEKRRKKGQGSSSSKRYFEIEQRNLSRILGEYRLLEKWLFHGTQRNIGSRWRDVQHCDITDCEQETGGGCPLRA